MNPNTRPNLIAKFLPGPTGGPFRCMPVILRHHIIPGFDAAWVGKILVVSSLGKELVILLKVARFQGELRVESKILELDAEEGDEGFTLSVGFKNVIDDVPEVISDPWDFLCDGTGVRLSLKPETSK